MSEDSGYFSRRSNEFRLPAHHHYKRIANNTNAGCHCQQQQQRICCCCNSSYGHNSSPRTYECSYVGPSTCVNNDTTAATLATTDPQCSSHYRQCRLCGSSSSSYNTNTKNTHDRDKFSPFDCHYHHHRPQNQDSQIESPYTEFGSDTQLCQQQSWHDCDHHNNNPSDITSSPLSSELISHSSLAYPGSGLTATNSSIGSRSNSGYLSDNNTSASSVGYQSSNSSRVGRARFSPDDILKLGYNDFLKSPALKRFSYGFQDERDFEDFKQDLRDFQLFKKGDCPILEDSFPSIQTSSGLSDSSSSNFQRSYARETFSDSEGTSDDNIPEFVTRRDRLDNRNSHRQQQHLPTQNHDWSNFCKVEKENCDSNQNNRGEVIRNITFSSFNADKLGRITGTDILENTKRYSSNSSSANLSKCSPTFSSFSSLTENGNPKCSFSSSPSSDNTSNKHGSLLVKRHSPRNLPSFQHLTPSLRTTSAPHDMLMDFFKSDEHFQEFEREFANLGRDFDVFNRLRRIDDYDEDGDSSRPASRGIEPSSSSSGSTAPIPMHVDSSRETESSVGSGSCTPIPIHVDHRPGGGSREPTPRSELMLRAGDSGAAKDEVGGFFRGGEDTFSDFFNNDEDFKEFEREFANFKLKRRSRAFADDFNRRSNCDLFADLFPGYEGQSPRERRSRGSASDWDYLFNKIKRNSNIFPENTQCLPERDADEQSPVFSAHNENIPPPPYQEHQSDNQLRTPRKTVEIAIQRRPPLPASPVRHLSPEVTRSSGIKTKPLELRIEHVSSPCSSPTCSSASSPRTPTGPSFVPRPRTDSPLLLHINEDELRDSPPIRRVLRFTDDFDENDDEPTTPTNTNQTVLHIDEPSTTNNNCNDENGERIVIEHRFSEGVSKPTTTITRRTKGSSSERSASPASPLTVRHQHAQPQSKPQQYPAPSSEINDRRRYTDPSRIVIEHNFSGRDSEPECCKQNRFSTALEFLHDVDDANKSDANVGQQKPHDKDCQYTCHEKCRQLVTLDCKNSLPNSGSDGSIETSLSEPASTPGSNSTISDTSPNDETDSGYRSGPIPEEILPKKQPSQATLNREDLKRKLQEYNNNVSFANLAMESDGETFQGFIKVTLNLIRPITMSLGARPPSIYEVLTREHIVEQNTQSISFYMPRDTVKSIHVDSETTTKEVISALLKKFKILDNPRKFAMYEQELQNGKIVKLRRVLDAECPLQICLGRGTENLQAHRLVLQENEATGDIEWSNFSLPELNNFLKVLDREQDEHINQLQYKYRMMKKVILQRLKEIRKCRNDVSPTSPSAPTGNGNHSPGGQTQKVI